MTALSTSGAKIQRIRETSKLFGKKMQESTKRIGERIGEKPTMALAYISYLYVSLIVY